MRPLLLMAIAIMCMGAHCLPIAGCPIADTRCTGNVAQICSADGRYQTLADCDLVSAHSGAPFVCAYVEEMTSEGLITGHTCVPASEVNATMGGAR